MRLSFDGVARYKSKAYESPPATAISRSPMPYKLSASLALHSSDVRPTLRTPSPRVDWVPTVQVRALASPTNDLILSASRDSTAILWQKPNPSAPFEQERTFRPGSGYVNAVTIVPPTPDAPKGVFLARNHPVQILASENRGGARDPCALLIWSACRVCRHRWPRHGYQRLPIGFPTRRAGVYLDRSRTQRLRAEHRFRRDYHLRVMGQVRH
jgi:hypothetical protein